MTYRIFYLDCSGLLRQSHAAGSTPAEAMAKVAACEPRCHRVTKALPITGA